MDDRDTKKAAGTGGGAVAGAATGGVAGGMAAGAAAGGMTGPVGAAVGAAVGAGVGALSGAGAASATDGSSGAGASHRTVIGAFDDRASAQRAVDRLVQSGFDRDDVHLQDQQGQEIGTQQGGSTGSEHKGGFFARLFGMDDDAGAQQHPHAQQAYTYDEAVRRGSAVVVVDANDEQQADRASMLLHEAGAVDVDERSKAWRSEGWTPPQHGMQQNLAGSPRSAVGTDQSQSLDVVEEQLQVGKRTVERGGVRVVQRVSSRPVRELVRLREEHAVVERRPVDRPATGVDLSNFKEGTLEVRETVEEPVVAKTARVVEEVRVGKEVREHEETIEDTVRRKDVEVERLGGAGQTGRGTRERAVAADDPLTGTRRTGDKDKPL